MSKTVLERKNPDGPFVFISYSHKDAETVGRLLTALNDSGADFWYDIKLRGGQDWLEKVREITAHKNCVGILYFLSPDFIASSACMEEYKLFEELKKSHDRFDSYFILLDDERPENFDKFIDNSIIKLVSRGNAGSSIYENVLYYKQNFDSNKIYQMQAKSGIDDDKFVKTVYNEVFAAWGCASEESGKIDVLVEDGLADRNYILKTDSYIVVDIVHRRDALWKVFAYNGNTMSAILISDELYSATCRSLASNVMDEICALINIAQNTDAEDERKNEKHLSFDPDFLECIIPDAAGNKVRYLRSAEHEKNYMQLKEPLEKASSESADDGYFFVTDNQDNILFADRLSNDVYRHIHVDAYASVFPVIDLDFIKYKEYIRKKS